MFEKYQDLINYVQSLFTKPVYLVGGSLRDIFLDRVPKDFDFATALTTEEIKEQLKGKHRTYLTGQKFGTIGFKVDTNDIEVTTFRTEDYSDGNRKPEVKFIDNIIPDLQRRDFTVNAIAYHDGKIIDPCGGRLDLLAKILKPVGTPKKMFKDDPLRLLRLARFASQLEFAVDQNLACQTKKYAYKILQVSKERWVNELDKLLMTDKPEIGLDFMMDYGLMDFIIPELRIQKDYNQNNHHHRFDLWTHTKQVVSKTPKDLILRWVALLHDIAKPYVRFEKKGEAHYYYHDYLGCDMVNRLAVHLKWSNDRRKEVSEIIKYHLRENSPLRPYDMEGH